MKDITETILKLTDVTKSWLSLPSGVSYSYLKDYYPINAYAGASLTEEEEADRKLVSDFGCKLLTTPEEHDEAVKTAVELVSDYLLKEFGDLVTELTLVPIPASSREITKSRYETFCREVAARTGIKNGYGLIYRKKTDEGTYEFAFKSVFGQKARCSLLFDDLISTGRTMNFMAYQACLHDSVTVGCLALGKVAKIDDNRRR